MPKQFFHALRTTLLLTLLLGILAGCATAGVVATDPQDPYESYNRSMFKFNMKVDKYWFKPSAEFYTKVLPWPVRSSIRNFFSNLAQLPTVANDLLQCDPYYATYNTWRFAINSTIGLLGLFDVAKHIGLPARPNDFGITLAKWGATDSPYFVLPLFGPSTVRDILGFAVDSSFFSIYRHLDDNPRYALFWLHASQKRADLLPADPLIADAFDPYIFVKHAYLQKRDAAIKHEALPEQAAEDTYVEGDDEDEDLNAAMQLEVEKSPHKKTNKIDKKEEATHLNAFFPAFYSADPYRYPLKSTSVHVPYRLTRTGNTP